MASPLISKALPWLFRGVLQREEPLSKNWTVPEGMPFPETPATSALGLRYRKLPNWPEVNGTSIPLGVTVNTAPVVRLFSGVILTCTPPEVLGSVGKVSRIASCERVRSAGKVIHLARDRTIAQGQESRVRTRIKPCLEGNVSGWSSGAAARCD